LYDADRLEQLQLEAASIVTVRTAYNASLPSLYAETIVLKVSNTLILTLRRTAIYLDALTRTTGGKDKITLKLSLLKVLFLRLFFLSDSL
jgi:hypothetical protein